MRVKRGGGEGGHNGLRSMSKSLGTKDYARVRFGIGRPPGRQDPADYVLSDFGAAERKELDFLVDRAADMVEAVVTKGVEPTQNALPRRPDARGGAYSCARDGGPVVCAFQRAATGDASRGGSARAGGVGWATGADRWAVLRMIDGAFARWLGARAGQALLRGARGDGYADAGGAEGGRRQGRRTT